MKFKSYHSILELVDGKWGVQFGDYEKAVVQEEIKEYRRNAGRGKGANFCIITTLDTQESINNTVAALNGAK